MMNGEDRAKLIRTLETWHARDKHKKIAAAIEKIDPGEWDYGIVSCYARALNNLSRYEEALAVLLPLRQEGAEDGKWHFRVGYALYFLGREAEAAEYFRAAIDHGDNDESTVSFLNASLGEAEDRRQGKDVYHPELYTEDQLDRLEDHIVRYFGSFKNVFHELASPDIHVDIAVVEPTKKRNYYTLVTMGMGARVMDVPPGLEHSERAELLICLPADWNLAEDALSDEKWYWPLRWLKLLARLPAGENTWLGWGHTVPAGQPLAENTALSGVLLLNPGAFGADAGACEIAEGAINFYQVIPLYDEEMEFKINNSTENLLDFFDDQMLACVDINRRNLCKGWKDFSLKKFNLAE
ncbi:MAG: suppressor of fused domain protein [Spirochaetaceae bacterium]|nr:suppressor of fused domain protein [Spirochaetaceae bacterium]